MRTITITVDAEGARHAATAIHRTVKKWREIANGAEAEHPNIRELGKALRDQATAAEQVAFLIEEEIDK